MSEGRATLLVEVAKLLPLACAGLWAVYEFRSAQKWRRSEYAAGLLHRLQSEPVLRTACLFLDWGARNCPLPEEYRFGSCTSTHSFVHTSIAMLNALKGQNGNGKPPRFSPEEVYYRDVFDAFFEYLAEVEHALRIKLIAPKQIAPLWYWIEAVYKHEPIKVFKDYVEDYHKSLSLDYLRARIPSKIQLATAGPKNEREA